MKRNKTLSKHPPALAILLAGFIIAFFQVTHPVRGQEISGSTATIREMIDLVTEASATFQVQSQLLAETRALEEPKPRSGLTATSIGLSSTFWDEEQDEPQVSPSASLTFTFSFRDPSSSLNKLNLAQARATADQEKDRIRGDLVGTLFDALEQISTLRLRQQELLDLQQELEARLERIEGERLVVTIEQLWDIEERLTNVSVELSDTTRSLELLKVRTAMQLGGSRWQRLLELLRMWDERDSS